MYMKIGESFIIINCLYQNTNLSSILNNNIIIYILQGVKKSQETF